MTTPQWALQRILQVKERGLVSLSLRRAADVEYLLDIPQDIFELTKLTTLDLSRNALSKLPDEIGNLENLITLDLRFNKISNLPDSISKLRNLKYLYLDENQLASLPDTFSELQNLVILNLSGNKFSIFPESILNLRSLNQLDLQSNQLIKLPVLIINLENLRWLYLSDNNLVDPPQEVAEGGPTSIQEYFRQFFQQGEDYLFEAKLLILGEGGAGKTTLARKIENRNYQLRDEKSTEGVDVTKWSFPIEGDKNFRVNIWDFGGQEIYHATHQFFLTKRSLYVLVADTRKEDTDFYYWLNVVQLLSDNSPLLIIKNEKQDRHRDLNERQLRGQFENLEEVLAANFETNRGLDRIVVEIQHYIKSLSHIGSRLPRSWVRVREKLENDLQNYISLEEYISLCRENGFAETKDSLQLSNYLHDIGVFLHFQDDVLLRKTVILKPKWGTDAVYKVLDNEKVVQNFGRFTRTDLKAVWSAPEYENMQDELLQLMMRFKLCYEIPSQKENYIAPQLLTENQPEYEWDGEDNLLLRYIYEFMPKGILLQFIVAMNEYILDHTCVWKSGVVLEKDKAQAEVIEYYGKRQIHIRISGVRKKELMTIVIYELEQIHNTYKRLKYDKLIPCNCKTCRASIEPHFYKYDQLQIFAEKRLFEIQCGTTGSMVNVRGLIDDVIEKEYFREERESPIAQYIIHGDYIDQGDKKMTDNKISISNSTVHGSVVAAESIKDSFNFIDKADIKDDLKEQLKQLSLAVEAMVAGLSKEKAEEVADDMKRLAEEAVKPSPSKKWYSVSVDGLTKVAENLGKVGEPVIKLAGKVLALLAAA